MQNKEENYNIIKDKIHAIKEEFPSLKNKSDDYAFSALAVKATYYKNPSLTLNESDINDSIVDGHSDGGVDILMSDPNSESSDFIIGQSKFYKEIKSNDVFNAIAKMCSFYKDMKEGHYENVNPKVQSRFITLNAEVGEESKIQFVFLTSANKNRISNEKLEKLIKDFFPDESNIELIVQFADDIVESIKELESRRPTVESGKIKIDKTNNYLLYGDDEAIIANISAFSLKQLYAQHNNNLLSRNLRYHVVGKTIDKGIEETIKNNSDCFWFKNNGITIICDDFYVDGREIKLKNFSIVNGGQTTFMIHKSTKVSENHDFFLPCKVIKIKGNTEDEKANFSLEIAKATNSQKAIKAIDLKANAPEQTRFSQAMRDVGIFYETKRGEKVPNDFKKQYLNTDLAEVGKLCLSGIFQMPGTSRNHPSKLYESPFYEIIFNGSQKQIAYIVRELLYIDYYWKKVFKTQCEIEIKNEVRGNEKISFANNSRTICIAFTVLAARYYYGNLNNNDITKICEMKTDSSKSDFISICSNLEGLNGILPAKLFENKTEYEKVLHDLFMIIIDYGFFAFGINPTKNDVSAASNYLKKDENYYSILGNSWSRIAKEIDEILSKI